MIMYGIGLMEGCGSTNTTGNMSTTTTGGYYTSNNTNTNGQQLISSDEANEQLEQISTLVDKGVDIANNVVRLRTIREQLDATIKQYEIDLENNKTTLEIRKMDVEIAQLNLASQQCEATYRLAEAQASSDNTKMYVYGALGVAGMALLGGLFYIAKK